MPGFFSQSIFLLSEEPSKSVFSIILSINTAGLNALFVIFAPLKSQLFILSSDHSLFSKFVFWNLGPVKVNPGIVKEIPFKFIPLKSLPQKTFVKTITFLLPSGSERP